MVQGVLEADKHIALNPIDDIGIWSDAMGLKVGDYVLLPGGFGKVITKDPAGDYIRLSIDQYTKEYGFQTWNLKTTPRSLFWVWETPGN